MTTTNIIGSVARIRAAARRPLAVSLMFSTLCLQAATLARRKKWTAGEDLLLRLRTNQGEYGV
jgi:hypothetical protein